jgi:hypothetical protein
VTGTCGLASLHVGTNTPFEQYVFINSPAASHGQVGPVTVNPDE